ncbi:hypothetical protein [Acidovorax soli]|uniref:hypothetical protein n=1 Tax=Acidovorax soli TaxID=592050 RepID=UPI0032B2D834
MLFNPDYSPLTKETVFNDETKALAAWDTGFARLHQWASRCVRVPSAVLTRSGELDVLNQHLGPLVPTVVIYTPRCLARHAVALGCTEPSVWNEHSHDLRSAGTHLSWLAGPYDLVLPEDVVHDFINEQYSYRPALELANGEMQPECIHQGHIAFVFVTPNRTAIQLLSMDEDLIGVLQCAGMSAGCNYRPVREHTEEELTEAAHNGPGYFRSIYDYNGRVRLELAVHEYRLGAR